MINADITKLKQMVSYFNGIKKLYQTFLYADSHALPTIATRFLTSKLSFVTIISLILLLDLEASSQKLSISNIFVSNFIRAFLESSIHFLQCSG